MCFEVRGLNAIVTSDLIKSRVLFCFGGAHRFYSRIETRFAKHNKPYLCESASCHVCHVILTYNDSVLTKAEDLNSCPASCRHHFRWSEECPAPKILMKWWSLLRITFKVLSFVFSFLEKELIISLK